MTRIEKVDQKHLTCRAYGHQWEPLRVVTEKADNHVIMFYRAALACLRCTTVREQVLWRDGVIRGNTYRYPEGYLQKHADDEVPFRRIDMRNEYIRRALGGAA